MMLRSAEVTGDWGPKLQNSIYEDELEVALRLS